MPLADKLERIVRADPQQGCALPLEVRNQARVHLWFEDYFGLPYPPLTTADEAIARYASASHDTKAARARRIWPELTVIEWADARRGA